jgi:hypothetical protein
MKKICLFYINMLKSVLKYLKKKLKYIKNIIIITIMFRINIKHNIK